MTETFSLSCIKCGSVYQSEDPEPYYCEGCNKQRKEIAKQVDAKLASRPRRNPESMLSQYERARRGTGFPSYKDFMGL